MRFADLVSVAAVAMACGCHNSSGISGENAGKDMATMAPVDDMAAIVSTKPDMTFIESDLASSSDLSFVANTGANVVPLVVDNGPAAAGGQSLDVGFISVKICAPGTTTCQTIDHISVDTGSVGLRIIGSVIDPTVLAALPNLKSTAGNNVTECYTYADGYVYGSVRNADLTIGGESAPGMAFNVLGDQPSTSTPASCKSGGHSENSVQSFGGNGIIGVGLFPHDCGADCTTGSTNSNPIYYECPTATSCTPTGLPIATQVQNPVTLFADNNGVVIDLPSIDDLAGATNPTGTLTFGIGTQSNNKVTTEQVYPAVAQQGIGTVDATVGTQKFSSIFDSGTSILSMTVTGAPDCTGQLQGYLCPTMFTSFPTTLTDANGKTGTTVFKIQNAQTLFNNADQSVTAFDDLATDGFDNLLIFGLPYFFGHKIFFAIDGASTPSGAGPYYAL